MVDFTPPAPIADFVLKWAFNGRVNQKILEPSCGDGVFLEGIAKNKHRYDSIVALELDSVEIGKASKINLNNTTLINEDFHRFCNSVHQRFDIIIGNPPYIRYQYFDKEQQKEANNIFVKAGLKYTKLTNAWVSFVVGSCLLLNDNGKLGFVLPAELLQVSYAKTLRDFLGHFFNKINIISFKKLVFPEIQQEVVLLLCEKNSIKSHLIEHLEVKDIKELEKIDINLLRSPKKEIDFKESKWTFYFLDQQEIDFLEELKQSERIPVIKNYSHVEVGITTGANKFFTVPKSIVEAFSLNEYAKPLVGRSVQVNSLQFTTGDWKANKKSNAKAHLLVFPDKEKMKKNLEALKYLKNGENEKIDKGYKCGIRDEWQIIPSIKLSNALFIRRNNKYPKLVENLANAYTTDTMHRVSVNKNVNIKAFVASFYNSLSFACSEIVGRSYGGGVLELMPSEVGQILLPYKEEHAKLIETLDDMFRKKISIDEILQYSDNIILKKGYGFSNNDIKIANRIWKKLSGRRLNRK